MLETGSESRRIVLAGGSGMLGTALAHRLQEIGHRVSLLVRPASSATTHFETIPWDPDQMILDSAALEESDALIHLGGVNVAEAPWTDRRKIAIRESRLKSTRLLSSLLQRLERPPKVFICASAIGYYGDRGDEWLSENSPPGSGFLANVCRDWESEAAAAASHVRVVMLRLGVVLSADGGALAKMLGPFKWGLGGRLGSGNQFMSWISQEDVIRAILFCLETPSLQGPVNLVAPEPVTNRQFTKVLARSVGRPAVLPLPGIALKLAMGKMATEMLLAGSRVSCHKLSNAGFQFHHPQLATALAALLH